MCWLRLRVEMMEMCFLKMKSENEEIRNKKEKNPEVRSHLQILHMYLKSNQS